MLKIKVMDISTTYTKLGTLDTTVYSCAEPYPDAKSAWCVAYLHHGSFLNNLYFT